MLNWRHKCLILWNFIYNLMKNNNMPDLSFHALSSISICDTPVRLSPIQCYHQFQHGLFLYGFFGTSFAEQWQQNFLQEQILSWTAETCLSNIHFWALTYPHILHLLPPNFSSTTEFELFMFLVFFFNNWLHVFLNLLCFCILLEYSDYFEYHVI